MTPDPEREALLARLRATCERAGTTPERVFRSRRWSVGPGFDRTPTLPPVEALSADQLRTLCGFAEQKAERERYGHPD